MDIAVSETIPLRPEASAAPTEWIERPDQQNAIEAAELVATLNQAGYAMIAPVGVAAALVPLFWSTYSRDILLALALVVAGLAFGILRSARFQVPGADEDDVSIAGARAVAIAFAFCLGGAWGAIPFFLFAAATSDQRMVLLGAVFAVAIDAFLIGPITSVCLAFALPLLAGCVAGILRDGSVATLPFAGMVAGIAALLAFAAHLANSGFRDRVAAKLTADDREKTIQSLLLDFEETTSDWYWETDGRRRLRNVSDRVAEAAGQATALLEGKKITTLFSTPRVVKAIGDRKPFRQELVELETPEGSIWWRLSGKPVYDERGAFAGYRGIGTDITEARNAEARISYLASFDSLTGLANRDQFQSHASRECAAAASDNHWRALLYLDLDGFKSVNDSFGHAAGDDLLKTVAGRLRSCVPQNAMVARLGGDEFAIWLSPATPAKAEALAETIIETIGVPFDVHGTQVYIGASIGIAFTPKHGTEPDTLLGKADLALYRAKADGKGLSRFFVEEYELSIAERRKLQSDMKLAIAKQEFELHYQPLVDLSHGGVSGFEALIRWRSPTRGFVSPADFIPAAETSGLIVAIGRWVLFQACKDAARWPDEIRVAVNVSPQQVRAPDFVQTVVLALKASGLPPSRLELEVTEGVFLDSSPSALTNLHALRDKGIRVALDDFGTGYSSLSYLINFPVDKIKIDRSFVRDCATRQENQAIVDAILTIARKLSIEVTAEGVETAEQALALKLRRCDTIQGFLLSKPRPLAEVPEMLSSIPAKFREIIPMGFESPLGLALAMKKQSA
jgi:diguanylate cyclase (GGDEF)-like protein/PAS domain S-box-containing protein